ncbi:MAG: hypothetical protein CM1200mP10_21680 [Candidatus Neomarinimicrobiota bacterium]|nr:MAG: hypothetical protein CM1200mP10_21680 [Candidatus Neomarinimicrobiota bacterium]
MGYIPESGWYWLSSSRLDDRTANGYFTDLTNTLSEFFNSLLIFELRNNFDISLFFFSIEHPPIDYFPS